MGIPQLMEYLKPADTRVREKRGGFVAALCSAVRCLALTQCYGPDHLITGYLIAFLL